MHFIKTWNVLLVTRFYSSDAGSWEVTIATGKKAICLQVNIMTEVQKQSKARTVPGAGAAARAIQHKATFSQPCRGRHRPTPPTEMRVPATQSRRYYLKRSTVPSASWRHGSRSDVRKKKLCSWKDWIMSGDVIGAKCYYLLETLSFNHARTAPAASSKHISWAYQALPHNSHQV